MHCERETVRDVVAWDGRQGAWVWLVLSLRSRRSAVPVAHGVMKRGEVQYWRHLRRAFRSSAGAPRQDENIWRANSFYFQAREI